MAFQIVLGGLAVSVALEIETLAVPEGPEGGIALDGYLCDGNAAVADDVSLVLRDNLIVRIPDNDHVLEVVVRSTRAAPVIVGGQVDICRRIMARKDPIAGPFPCGSSGRSILGDRNLGGLVGIIGKDDLAAADLTGIGRETDSHAGAAVSAGRCEGHPVGTCCGPAGIGGNREGLLRGVRRDAQGRRGNGKLRTGDFRGRLAYLYSS